MTENDQNCQNGHRESTVSHFNGFFIRHLFLAFERAQTNDLQLVLGGATQGNLDKPDDDDPQWQVQQIVILGERVSGVP
jgi:hypothetical protein